MERFSYRDHILLGLGHNRSRRSLGSLGYSSRNSDEDFSDVFGEEELVRRKYSSDDLLDDVFRGEHSSSSTPRKLDWNPFSVTPASRIQSPVRPLASVPDQFLDPSSIPRHLSLPSKLAKGMDSLVCGTSPSCRPDRSKDGVQTACSPSPACARVSNQVVLQGQEDLKIDVQRSYCQSPLSHEFPTSRGESSKAIKCGNKEKREQHIKKGSSRSEMHDEYCNFSIYKWASRGAAMVMPFRGGNSSTSKATGKSETVASELSIEIPSQTDRTSKLDSLFHIECENRCSTLVLNSVAADNMESFRFNYDSGFPKFNIELEAPPSLGYITTEIPHSLTTTKEVKETHPFSGVPGSSPGKGLRGVIKKQANVFIKAKAGSKSLCSMFYEDSDGQGKDEIVRQAEGKKDKGGGVKTIFTSFKNIAGGKRLEVQDKRKIFDLGSKCVLQDTGENSKDKLSGNKFKEKIKEFVKNFNQEAPSNHITHVSIQGHRWKEKGTSDRDDGACVSATKADGKKVTNLSMDKTLTNGQTILCNSEVYQTMEQPEKSHFILNKVTNKACDMPSGMTSNLVSFSETIPGTFKAPLVTEEEYHREDLRGSHMVKESSPYQNQQLQTVEYHEEFQISDARIRQWSNGRETNIRALLSTLQYVLWLESGWKSVPLVDIIEVNSVKRAYQKALLCLHPDKLQQKGVSPQQKYIAEKVYDILQEAWTYFNSLSTF